MCMSMCMSVYGWMCVCHLTSPVSGGCPVGDELNKKNKTLGCVTNHGARCPYDFVMPCPYGSIMTLFIPFEL